MANLSHRGTGEGKEYTLMENIYVDYLDKHPSLKSKQTWLDRQLLSNGKLSTYIAYFYILQYENCENQYVGIVESTRPHSGTYIYMLPNNHVRLYSYIYKRHFEEPFIRRKPDQEYIDIMKKINRKIDTDENYVDELQEDLEETIEDPFKPLKCREYFLKEIAHTNITKWSKIIESTINHYLSGGKFPTNPKYKIVQNFDLIRENEVTKLAIMPRSVIYGMELDCYFETADIIREIQHIYREKEKKIAQEKDNSKRDKEDWPIEVIQMMQRIKNKKVKSPQQTGEFAELYDKDIKQIASFYHISPIDLLLKINRQEIKGIHINSVTDILNSKQVRLCKQIFEELSKDKNRP